MPKYRSLPIEKERMLTHLYDAKMKELPDERQGTALWGRLLVGAGLPREDVPLQLLDIEPHLSDERQIVRRARGLVLVVGFDPVRVHPAVQHGLRVLHGPVTWNVCFLWPFGLTYLFSTVHFYFEERFFNPSSKCLEQRWPACFTRWPNIQINSHLVPH